MTYSLVCEECGRGLAEYFGESGRNGYTRGREHLTNKEAANENKSVLKLHSNHHHNGADVRYSMIVTGVHKDCMDRQVMEGVNISNFGGDILMNRIGESGGVRVERQQYKFQEVPPIHTLPTCKRLLWCLGDASPGA